MTQTDRTLGLLGNVGIKVPVRVATTAAITLSGLQTIDGITLVADDRVLVKTQASAVDNGIYVADTGTWERAKDFDGTYDAIRGTLIVVNQGTINAGLVYRVTTADPFVIGTDALDFSSASSEFVVTGIITAADGSAA